MQIVITPTPEFVILDGQPCRKWSGKTDGGSTVEVFVRMIKVDDAATVDALKAANLKQAKPPKLSGKKHLPGVVTPPDVATGLM